MQPWIVIQSEKDFPPDKTPIVFIGKRGKFGAGIINYKNGRYYSNIEMGNGAQGLYDVQSVYAYQIVELDQQIVQHVCDNNKSKNTIFHYLGFAE